MWRGAQGWTSLTSTCSRGLWDLWSWRGASEQLRPDWGCRFKSQQRCRAPEQAREARWGSVGLWEQRHRQENSRWETRTDRLLLNVTVSINYDFMVFNLRVFACLSALGFVELSFISSPTLTSVPDHPEKLCTPQLLQLLTPIFDPLTPPPSTSPAPADNSALVNMTIAFC